MTSTAGDMAACIYEHGECILPDKTVTIWKPHPTLQCRYIIWKELKGEKFGTNWISDDRQIALTFREPRTIRDCTGIPMDISDQETPYKIKDIIEYDILDRKIDDNGNVV